LMQDRTSANSMKVLLQRAAGPYIGVKTGRQDFRFARKTRHLRANEYAP